MNNGQLPPGGGGGGNPQQPHQLMELLQVAQAQARARAQAQALAQAQVPAQLHQLQAQIAIAAQNPDQAQILNGILMNPQMGPQLMRHLQQAVQAQIQNPVVQQFRLHQELQEQRYQQVQLHVNEMQRLQEEQLRRQEQQRLLELQRQQEQMQLQLPDLRNIEQEYIQQLQQLLPLVNQAWNRQGLNPFVAAQPPPLPVHVQRNQPQQPSPAQRVMAANSPAMNQIENFIIQEENNALRGVQRPQQPQPIRPVPQAPRGQQQIHIPHVPLVRVNNLLVQQPAQQLLLQPIQQVFQNQVPPAPAPAPQEPLVEQVAQQQPQVEPQLQQMQQMIPHEIALPTPSPSPPPAAPVQVVDQVDQVNQVQQPEPPELEEEEEGEDEQEDEEAEEEEEVEGEGEEAEEGGQPEQPPRVDEALYYLRVIKQTFQDDVPVYHRFLEIMKEFRAQRLETPDVIEQVAELLYRSPNLVLGFNTFLPAGFRISLAEDGRYLFTSPDNEPKTLLSPEERAVLRESVLEGYIVPEGMRRERIEQEEDEEDSDDDKMEEDDPGPEAALIEEVVPDDSVAAPVQNGQGESSEDDVLKIVELLQKCFHARPGKLVCFTTFMDMLISTQSYKRKLERQVAEDTDQNRDEVEEDSNQPGPAPLPVDENMEVEEEEEQEERAEVEEPRPQVRVISDQERLDCIAREHDQFIISLAAKACMGEPELLAALIDFLPYLRKLLENGSELVMQKINAILEFKPTNSEPIDPEMADKELTEKMEQTNMGTSKNEKLVIRKSDEPGSSDEMLVLQKSYRILYEKLKLRTTATQIGQLVVLLNMFLNMDLSKQDLVTEVPRIMGRQGSEVESLILNLLGMNKDPKDLPENDVDAVMRKDMPPVRAKRGLRVQKLMPQIKTADVATVCTLGPSYRLMKDPKEGECFGRIEMEDEIKETLNDKWSSWPSYSSEDTGTQQTKKSNLEEFHFRTEDERYELDIIVDSNRTIMEELDMILRHYSALSDKEREEYKWNDQLNCQSRATFFRVMTKVYTNSVLELVEAVKNNPIPGLAKIIAGLQEKDAQWTRFQQDANRTWRDALDKQLGASTALLSNQQKSYDQKAFKSKPLVNAIEQVFEDKKKAGDEDNLPHMTLEYTPEEKVYQDVNDVVHHFFHDLPGSKNEGDRSKLVLFRVLMEWLCQTQDNVMIDESVEKAFKFEKEDEPETSSGQPSAELDDAEKFRRNLYKRERRVFYGDDAVYLVIRYHHMIQERFAKLLASQVIFSQEFKESQQKQSKWQTGIGSLSQAREVLEKNVVERKAAVEDIKNVRHCPSAYYTTTLRELKQLGSAQTDLGAFEDTVRNLFPGDVSLFNNIDKLFTSLAKNIHHASCAEGKENPIGLYLKYRKRLIETEDREEREAVEQEYAQTAEEVLRGKNTYRFEFIDEKNAPFINIWVIPREEKESEDDDDDEDGGNDDKDDNNDKNDEDKENELDEEMPPTNEDDNEEEEEEDGSEESPSGAEGPEEPTTGEEEMDVETKSSSEEFNQELKLIPNFKSLLSQIKNFPHRKNSSSRGIEKISKTRIIRARDCDKMVKQHFTQPILPLIYA